MHSAESGDRLAEQRPEECFAADVARLELLLREQSSRGRELEAELERQKALFRELTTRIEGMVPVSSIGFHAEELPALREAHRAAVARAVEAEASRTDFALRLDEALGHLAAARGDESDGIGPATPPGCDREAARAQVYGLQEALHEARAKGLVLERKLARFRESVQARTGELHDAQRTAADLRHRLSLVDKTHEQALRQREAAQREALLELESQLQEACGGEAATLSAQLDGTEQRLADAQGQLADVAERCQVAETAAKSAARQRDERERRIEVLQQELAEKADLARGREETIAGLQATLAEREASLRAARNQCTAAQVALSLREKTLTGLRAELDRARQIVSGYDVALDALRSELEGARHEASSREETLSTLQMDMVQNAQVRAEYHALVASNEAADKERQRVADQLARVQDLLRRLRAGLVELAAFARREADENAQPAAPVQAGASPDTPERPSDFLELRVAELAQTLSDERRARSDDKRNAHRETHALKAECEALRDRLQEDEARLAAASDLAQALQSEAPAGSVLQQRIAALIAGLKS